MIYVIYSAPWGSGIMPFEERQEKKLHSFLKDLKKNHSREQEVWNRFKQEWRGHKNVTTFNLSVTFKIADLWNQ